MVVLRFFKGDYSARQFETGHQKGGNLFCITCLIHASKVKNIASSFRKKALSIQDRAEKVENTSNSVFRLERKSLELYDNLGKPDIIDELHRQKVKFMSSLWLKELIDLLLNKMHCIHRLPLLLFDYYHYIYYEIPFYVDKANKWLVTKVI